MSDWERGEGLYSPEGQELRDDSDAPLLERLNEVVKANWNREQELRERAVARAIVLHAEHADALTLYDVTTDVTLWWVGCKSCGWSELDVGGLDLHDTERHEAVREFRARTGHKQVRDVTDLTESLEIALEAQESLERALGEAREQSNRLKVHLQALQLEMNQKGDQE